MSIQGDKMATIIPFPGIDPETLKPFMESEEEQTRNYCIDVALDMSIGVFNKLDVNPIAARALGAEHQKDMVLIHEAIKSCLLRMYALDHPLQKTANELDLEKLTDIKFQD
jgi:hypothetical protein